MARRDVNLALLGTLLAVVIGFIVWAPTGLPWEWGGLRPAVHEDVIETFMSMRVTLDSLGGEDRETVAMAGIDKDDVWFCQGAVMALEDYLLRYAGGSPSPDEKMAEILNLGGCASILKAGRFGDTVNNWWDEYWHSS